jgi:hypothetical protein
MATTLERITDMAKAKPKERFTSLAHLINVMRKPEYLQVPARSCRLISEW